MSKHLHWTKVPVEPEPIGEGMSAHFHVGSAFGVDAYEQLDGLVFERGSASYVWLMGYVEGLRGRPEMGDVVEELDELLTAVKTHEQVLLRIAE